MKIKPTKKNFLWSLKCKRKLSNIILFTRNIQTGLHIKLKSIIIEQPEDNPLFGWVVLIMKIISNIPCRGLQNIVFIANNKYKEHTENWMKYKSNNNYSLYTVQYNAQYIRCYCFANNLFYIIQGSIEHRCMYTNME